MSERQIDGGQPSELQTIEDVGGMPPFLMSVLSATDLWMFLASNGGLTAGRTDAAHSLFPYETVDRLYERPGLGGGYTALRLRSAERSVLWRPFAFDPADSHTRVSLSKSLWGDEVAFEARHDALGLVVRQSWNPSEAFGWVRRCEIRNEDRTAVEVELLDGLLDILPAGVALTTQQRGSNLVDAYRHIDVEPEDHLAWYGLSSLIVDRAEPAEALRANVVWSYGLEGTLTVEPRSVDAFLRGLPVTTSSGLRGRKGAFLHAWSCTLGPDESRSWGLVGDVALDGAAAAELRAKLKETSDRRALVEDDVRRTHVELERLSAALDGVQVGREVEVTANHLANALFNGFRGGILTQGGSVPVADFVRFVTDRNRPVASRHATWLDSLPQTLSVEDLTRQAAKQNDPSLERLALEYLPLAFGRRHGDPSRPWNQFSIRTKTAEGERILNYEGNWRDIFQNWEALAISYPAYLPSMIAKFVNAMTVDGFNPYRLTRQGIDWEVPDPEDPWSNIGYWGDHQLIYLVRLLEALERFDPERLRGMLNRGCFSFAAVPYRIAPYEEICANPRDTIRFDEDEQRKTEERSEAVGADGRLVQVDGSVAHATLGEKLLIPILAKVANLVLDGGVWMNTQRPEWNDANNALAGFGLSVVTMAHALRYVRFLRRALQGEAVRLHAPVDEWLAATTAVLERYRPLLGTTHTPQGRRELLDDLGIAYSTYRSRVYASWTEASNVVEAERIDAFLSSAEAYLRCGTELNRRDDGLFHSYNVLSLKAGRAEVSTLAPMLEGQVAVLDSGLLSADEVGDLVEEMYRSPLYVSDRNSFLLYPDRELPSILDRGVVDESSVESIPLLASLLESGRRDLVLKDAEGRHRFSGAPANGEALEARLDALAEEAEWADRVERDRDAVLALYESTFRHASFTGRSGWMYGFEGLGCIYWHMVAKLAVAIQECYATAPSDSARRRLAAAYHRVRGGLGFNKSAAAYGAFPTDPYSHTPAHAGAQQPGMTGQVKEQVITRFQELGAIVEGGRVRFSPSLLPKSELLGSARTWRWVDAAGNTRSVEVPESGVGFTWAETPIIYRFVSGANPRASVTLRDGGVRQVEGSELDEATSRALLGHDGSIERIDVELPLDHLLTDAPSRP